jgi:LuxR family transcriptional regulator, activator of tox operons
VRRQVPSANKTSREDSLDVNARSHGAIGPAIFCEAVEALGEPEFPDRLFACASRITGADLCSAFAVRISGQVEFLFARGTKTNDPSFPESASLSYARNFWRYDPMFVSITSAAGADRIRIVRQPWSLIPKSEYRAFCYERPGIVERISIAASVGPTALLFNLYRSRRVGQFSSRDFAAASHIGRLCSAVLSKHVTMGHLGTRLRPPVERIAERLQCQHPNLSEREVEVCSTLLMGKSGKEAARICGIKVSTLLTYKERAFEKLDIATIGELVRLYEDDAQTGMLPRNEPDRANPARCQHSSYKSRRAAAIAS